MEWFRSIEEVEARFEALSARLADPALVTDPKQYQQAAKKHSEIAGVVDKYRAWKETARQIDSTRLMMDDPRRGDRCPRRRGAGLAGAFAGSSRQRDSHSAHSPSIPTTKKASCSKSGQVQVATKPRFLPRMCSGCTRGTRKCSPGRSTSPLGAIPNWVALRRSSPWFTGRRVYSKLKYGERCAQGAARTQDRIPRPRAHISRDRRGASAGG